MADPTAEVLNKTLKALQTLRTNVTKVYEQLKDGMSNSEVENEKEKAYVTELKKQLITVNENYSDIEKQVPLLAKLSQTSMGNLGVLSLEPVIEKQPIYAEILHTYKWTNKVSEYAFLSHQMLSANSLKRSLLGGMSAGAKRQRKVLPVCHVSPPATVDKLINTFVTFFPELTLVNISRPLGSPTCVELCVTRVMRVLFVLRGLLIEHVLVKAYDETFYDQSNKIDIWSKSKHHVFRKITEHASSATFHFHYPIQQEIALRLFLGWLRSYKNLFSAPCVKCERYLANNLPPTLRDYSQYQVTHEAC